MEQTKTAKLASVEDCTGCAACANACAHDAIRMVEDDEGFLFPHIDESQCVGCLLCQKSCPVLTIKTNENKARPDVYALWSNEDRTSSSSGGAFSAFARTAIASGGAVYGAAFDDELHLRHVLATSLEELKPLRGSKYVQSEIGKDLFRRIKKQLLAGTHVLFCGTPCQVAGLKSYLRKDYDTLLTIDLVCHGVPSGKTFKNYIKKLASRVGAKEIGGFQFRRLDGWGFSPTVQLSGKFAKIFGIDNLYMEAFDKSALFRKSCYSCPFAKLPRQGDCTLGDFWGIGRHGAPFKHDTMKGVSLVMVNSEKGQKALDALDNVFVERHTLNEAIVENHNVVNVSVKHHDRDTIIKMFNNEEVSLDEINKRFGLVDRSLKGTVKRYSEYLGLFDAVKRLYNKIRTL